MTALTTLLDGGKYYEAPRWHDGRLWFVDCLARTLLSTDTAGQCRTHATFEDDTPCGTGFLPDGRLIVLTMFRKRLFVFAEDKLSLYADLSGVATGVIDDMIVDGLGRAYVGDLGFNFPPPPDRGADGRIIQVAPDGATRVVAEGLRFPNGIAISPDHRRLVVAEMDGECVADYEMAPDGSLTFRRRLPCGKEPDGICLDHDGAVWVAAYSEDAFIRIDASGQELQRIAVPGRRAIACALGGPEQRTLFCISAATSHEDLRRGKSSARIDTVTVDAPGAGYP
ncbi:SMP-30/gluconolactonase/LRE family protein [Bradyrhizobium sp. WYCCWR 13023]|uniref:SMP-30/gluconolactonase/LRE family protein n=1 Tax=Bradyrhizobium zhengyangense TaxID=2911009 RepID=A0A9X1U823_9BRAD|nr:SMP-30/gluconolactonase/LRE family protein [Bradyrhizobium zhengyangense]MCG2628590.1 SMP-30/gluconolactonase/LRE family protein [Bradyrhizobium zhengyangense]MCG2644122.1 SMP-30/gluconolactonase/LRE family protein [Bradyrhizobium zhengyangense]